jgi:transcriptional regulator with XRE-family HTH domain
MPRRDTRSVQVRVGERVRALREAAHLTQAELARRAGVAKSFISTVERGGQAASITSLDRIARALRAPLRALFDDEPAPPPPGKEEALIAAIVAELRGRDAEFLAGVRGVVRALDRMVSRSHP